jgi:hypothetical protein
MFKNAGKSVAVVTSAVAAAVLLSGAVGCSSKKKPTKEETYQADFFPSESEQRSVDRFIEVQAAEGAKDDAMLFASHFDGNELNTAGQVKLNLMLRNQTSRQPMVVYLNLPQGDTLVSARRTAVEQHIKDSGVAIASLEVKEGDNPAMLTNANTNLRNLPKTDSDYQGSGGGRNTQSDTRSNNTGGGSSPTSMSPPSSSK